VEAGVRYLTVTCLILYRLDWLICDWVWDLMVPTHVGLSLRALCALVSIYGSPVALLKFQMAPRLILLISSGSKKKEPRYTHLCKAKVPHSQRMWTKVSSSAAQFLHSGLSDSHIRWRCLLRVLCPVKRPVTALDYVLFKNRNLALVPRQGPEISSWASLWVSPRPHLYRLDRVASKITMYLCKQLFNLIQNFRYIHLISVTQLFGLHLLHWQTLILEVRSK